MAPPGTESGVFRFGPFELTNLELRKRGKVVKLPPQQFAVLRLLVECAGQIVLREAIYRRIWGDDTFVDFENGINFAINQIRAALGDDADKPRYVETIPRRGYRFLCPLEPAGSPAVRPEKEAAEVAMSAQSAPIFTSTSHHPGSLSIHSFRDSGKGPLLGGLVVVLILVALFIGGRRNLSLHPWMGKTEAGRGRPHAVTLTNLRGLVDSPVFSPDGKQIAFFWNGLDENKSDIYVQPIDREDAVRLTYSGNKRICCIDWAPDGQGISFVRCDNGAGAIYTVPVLGGTERKLTDLNFCRKPGTPRWTPDGKSMVLIDSCIPEGPSGIILFSLATGQKRCLSASSSNGGEDSALALSPDGKTIAFFRRATTSILGGIYAIPIEGGTPRRLTSEEIWISDMMWAADGKRIIFLSPRGGHWFFDRLWNVSVEGGDIQPETVYPHLGALSRDGKRLAYVADGAGEPQTIWQAELASPGGQVLARKRIVASQEYNAQPQLSPDRTRIAFSSTRSGSGEIWRSEADGSNPIQLTAGGKLGGTPRWSPDGKSIVFDRTPGKYSQIFIMDADGRNVRAMTDGNYSNFAPSWSRDGQSIYYGSSRTGTLQMWKQAIRGGRAVQITQHGGFTGFESYDGKTLYYAKENGGGLWSVPASSGMETLVTPALRTGYWGAWAASETGIYLIDDSVLPRPTIEFYNFRTRKLTTVMQIDYSALDDDPCLDASRDGRIVLFAQYRPQSSIAMVEDLQ